MIKSGLILLGALLITNHVFSQPDFIKDATYHFNITNNQLIGQGADSLKKYISTSQFFLIGEEHDMVELQKFTACIMPFLKNSGYKYLAVEIGSESAKKLTSIYRNKESLRTFNTKYYKYFGGGPFGFFDGKEEEVLLDSALNNGLSLWGIDFENYDASLFILDELYNQSNKDKAIKDAYQKAYDFVIKEYANKKNNKNYPLQNNLLNSILIKSFFNLLPDKEITRKLIYNITLSWKIYEAEGMNNWYPRVDNMKKNFIKLYKEAAKKENLPKVVIKLGAAHTARGTSSSGFQEVGNTIYELANYNNTKSFSVISFARYRIDQEDNLTDELEPEDEALLKYTTKDSWSLINLKQLSIDGWQGKIKLSSSMQGYIEKYDMMLIPPATKRMKANIIGD
jgi:hypothetical protein